MVALSLGLVVGMLVPAHAAATRVSVFGPDDRRGIRGEILIVGTKGTNRISVSYAPASGTFVVADPSGIATTACERLTATRARCASPVDSRIEIAAREGQDRVRLARSVRTGARVDGGSGTDVLVGGRFGDDLIGGGGDDVLLGKAGDDDLGGLFDRGRDEFYGGGGNDDIDASERRSTPDLVISCGAGRLDDAFVDRGRDPRPNGCEDVVGT